MASLAGSCEGIRHVIIRLVGIVIPDRPVVFIALAEQNCMLAVRKTGGEGIICCTCGGSVQDRIQRAVDIHVEIVEIVTQPDTDTGAFKFGIDIDTGHECAGAAGLVGSKRP